VVNRVSIADIEGTRWAGIRQHFKERIEEVYKMDTSFESFPEDHVQLDYEAYLKAMATMKKGDLVVIFTPDNTHFQIALHAVQRGLHVLIAKPAVKTLNEHQELLKEAQQRECLVAVEYHKRWDPCYADARERMANQLGDFNFFQAYMAQPKLQLETFKHWAGKASDISYYLNSHHIDIHCWGMKHKARPIRVTAAASTGVANKIVNAPNCEDTITLLVDWENLQSKTRGHAIYTASWITSKGDVHSQQYFYYLGQKGEIRIDQAHRGYTLCTDSDGYSSVNPLYMKYTPDRLSHFAGQNGYGYQSIEAFVRAVVAVNQGTATLADVNQDLANFEDALQVTAILDAGRKSLDANGAPYEILYDQSDSERPIGLRPVSL